MAQIEPNLPEEEIRVGGTVSTSIWRNEVQRGDRTVVNFSVQLQRRYFDRADQEWKTAKSLNTDDVPRAILALQKAYEYILINADRSPSNSSRGAG